MSTLKISSFASTYSIQVAKKLKPSRLKKNACLIRSNQDNNQLLLTLIINEYIVCHPLSVKAFNGNNGKMRLNLQKLLETLTERELIN